MVTIKNNKERLLHRMKIIQGHLKKVMTMIDEDAYCIDIVHQSLALQKALKQIDMLIMEEHLKTCAVEQIRDGQEEKTIEELISIYKYK
ncbi:metal-sensing transcriptional repressor [Candidatus Woesebacteria bacterium]|nr:metal-sensing transcriptional repressor [Candidatus Woesebacteria bacterium]